MIIAYRINYFQKAQTKVTMLILLHKEKFNDTQRKTEKTYWFT